MKTKEKERSERGLKKKKTAKEHVRIGGNGRTTRSEKNVAQQKDRRRKYNLQKIEKRNIFRNFV